ncbi:hypothetical protein NKI79_28315 [Mesorhizobium sp. M0340]
MTMDHRIVFTITDERYAENGGGAGRRPVRIAERLEIPVYHSRRSGGG